MSNRRKGKPQRPSEDQIVRAAAALVTLLRAAPEHLNELARERESERPSWLNDQLDAAESEAHNLNVASAIAMAAGPNGLGVVQASGLSNAPEWVLERVADTAVRFWAGVAETCRHRPDPNRPEPLFAAYWKPRTVVCLRCADTLSYPRGSDADMSCDRCGRVVMGTVDDPMWSGRLNYGPMIFGYGVCSNCKQGVHHG